MPYLPQIACIAAMVSISLTGCLMDDPSRTMREPVGAPPVAKPADRYVPGAAERVCMLTEATLSELNVLHFTVREAGGGGIRFDCRTARDARFCLCLVDVTVKKDQPRTRIHVGWERDPEREDGLSDPVVVKILNGITAKAEEEQRRKSADPNSK